MLTAYAAQSSGLTSGAGLADALWLDMVAPDAAEEAAVRALGVDVPTLADMEEIEISNRLYRENGLDYMTVVVPSLGAGAQPHTGPVCFILGAGRLVTVRHHLPRPFETYPPPCGQGWHRLPNLGSGLSGADGRDHRADCRHSGRCGQGSG